ncbi:MAG: hypothetical protein IJD57_02250 [Candidatus Gastranaerophilales bacterium]|nr:hypothetical protein [Candidatus Gastranaerophilales bacterium]
MAIDKLPFLQASNPYGNYGTKGVNKPQASVEGYHQAYQAPTTTPVITPSYKPEEKLAFMEAVNNGEIDLTSANLNPFSNPITPNENVKGSAWGEGFKVPENNGTGELQPVVSDREDSIKNCPWEAYYC